MDWVYLVSEDKGLIESSFPKSLSLIHLPNKRMEIWGCMRPQVKSGRDSAFEAGQ